MPPKQLKSQKEILQSLGEEERKKLVAHLGRGMKGPKDSKHNANEESSKFLVGRNNETIVVDREEASKVDTIFLKDVNDCDVTIRCRSAKILIESCRNSRISIAGLVMTNTVEIWKCDNTHLNIASKVATIQADMCETLHVNYARRELMFQIVWMGINALHVNFEKESEHSLSTGYDHMVEQMQQENPNMVLSKTIDQFVVRFVQGKLKSEQMVRLENGFPTTEREAIEFDEKKKKNDLIMEKHLRKVIRVAEKKHGKDVGTVIEKKKPFEVVETSEAGDDVTFPIPGDTVKVLYQGKLAATGEVFDEKLDSADPFEFVIGRGFVVPGFDESIATFSKGQKSIVKISADYAYGVNGVKDAAKMKIELEKLRAEKEAKKESTKDLDVPPIWIIPPNSDLIFEVKLMDIVRSAANAKPAEPQLSETEAQEIADSFLPDSIKKKAAAAKGKKPAAKKGGKKKK